MDTRIDNNPPAHSEAELIALGTRAFMGLGLRECDAAHVSRILVTARDSANTAEATFDAPPAVVWDWVTSPARRIQWQHGVTGIEPEPAPNPPAASGRPGVHPCPVPARPPAVPAACRGRSRQGRETGRPGGILTVTGVGADKRM